MTLRSVFEVTPAPGMKLELVHGDAGLAHPRADPATGSLRWELDRQPNARPPCPRNFTPTASASKCAAHRSTPPVLASRLEGLFPDRRADHGSAPGCRRIRENPGRPPGGGQIRPLGPNSSSDRVRPNQDRLSGDHFGQGLRGRYRPHPAAEVLRNRFGDCKDKATCWSPCCAQSGKTGAWSSSRPRIQAT